MTERNERVERLVATWILEQYADGGDNAHLRTCPKAMITDQWAEDSFYGCETGCDFARWGGMIACTHGERDEYEGGEFGMMTDIIERLVERDT